MSDSLTDQWFPTNHSSKTNKRYYSTTGEKKRWEFHKNARCSFEQILEAAPNKTVTVRPLTSNLVSYPSNKTC